MYKMIRSRSHTPRNHRNGPPPLAVFAVLYEPPDLELDVRLLSGRKISVHMRRSDTVATASKKILFELKDPLGDANLVRDNQVLPPDRTLGDLSITTSDTVTIIMSTNRLLHFEM